MRAAPVRRDEPHDQRHRAGDGDTGERGIGRQTGDAHQQGCRREERQRDDRHRRDDAVAFTRARWQDYRYQDGDRDGACDQRAEGPAPRAELREHPADSGTYQRADTPHGGDERGGAGPEVPGQRGVDHRVAETGEQTAAEPLHGASGQ
ncbi:hypothetical protein GCM10027068_51510 [Prescottella soli]